MTIERIPIAEHERFAPDRMTFIGASDVAIVTGESNYGSLAELYAQMKGLRGRQADSGALRRGRWGEAAVFEALAEERPDWNVRRAKVHVRDTIARLACTPDGFAEAPFQTGIGIVQAKVVARSVFRDNWLDDPADSIDHGAATVPTMYRLQVLTEMMLNELSWGIIAVVINGEYDWSFRTLDIERDEVLEDLITFHVKRFWKEHLDPGIMPPFHPQRDERLVKALYPKDDGTVLDLTGDNRALALADDLAHTQAARLRIEKAEAELKLELQAKLAEHTYGRLADGRYLSWKSQHRSAFSVPPSDFRVLRILQQAPRGLSPAPDPATSHTGAPPP